jgi:hypothetical protein
VKTVEEDGIEENGLSLNATAENYVDNTIRIKGSCQGEELIILIDSESTHSFIDEKVMLRIKVAMVRTTVLAVTVANENIMRCDAHNFLWFMQVCKSWSWGDVTWC